MKKFWSILCACAVLLTMMPMLAVSVSAAGEAVITIETVTSPLMTAGETFTVRLSTNRIARVAALELHLMYDATKIKAISGTASGWMSELDAKRVNCEPMETEHGDPNIGEVWLTGMSLKDKDSANGEVFATITFQTVRSIVDDVTIEAFGETLVVTSDVIQLPCRVVNGGLKIVKPTVTTKKTTAKPTVTTKKTTAKPTVTTTKTTAKPTVTTKKTTARPTVTTTKTTTTKKVTTTTKKTATTTKPIYFPDVKKGDWYYDAVQYVARREYMTGFKNGNFGPASNMQRQDFVLILSRIANADLTKYKGKTGGLKDVDKNAYYAPAVAWAVDQGIVTGYNSGRFGVGDPITREQVCTIFYRYKGSPKVSNTAATLKVYPDGKNISPFAKEAVVWASQNGVMTGMKSGNFSPQSNAARAQVATIVMRMDQAKMFQ